MCFSIEWIKDFLIWLVVLGAVVAVVRLFLPRVLAPFGEAGAMVLQVLTIIVWAIVLIAIIVFAFQLLSCLGGVSMPRLR